MIVIDTSIVVAYMNAADDHHNVVSSWLDGADDDLATTPLIIAEVDHLVGARGGPAALRALRADLVAGAYIVDWWPTAIRTAVRIAERYADAKLGLADASLVALAERLATINIATLDERHFRAYDPSPPATRSRSCPPTRSHDLGRPRGVAQHEPHDVNTPQGTPTSSVGPQVASAPSSADPTARAFPRSDRCGRNARSRLRRCHDR